MVFFGDKCNPGGNDYPIANDIIQRECGTYHNVKSHTQTLEILEKHSKKKESKILIHCFTGSREFAFKLLNLGAYISASGVVTFKKSQDLANTFRDIPNEKY